MASIYSNMFQGCIENLLLAEKHIGTKDAACSKEKVTRHNINMTQYWKDIDIISKKLSFECTKLCISFINEPKPTSSETSALLELIEKAVVTLVSIICKLEPSNGKTLHGEVLGSGVNAIQSTRQLLRVLKDENEDIIKERYLRATGIAWEGCKDLENCPHSNKEAVTRLLSSQNSLVGDACEEITQALEGDGGGWDQLGTTMSDSEDEEQPATWSSKDKELVGPVLNIIKAAKILYKRILEAMNKNGRSDDSKCIEDFDLLLSDCNPVSETIDNLILEIYPPLNVPDMELQARQLANHIQSALKTVSQSHIITENEQSNVEFIDRAVSHNLDKFKQLLKES